MKTINKSMLDKIANAILFLSLIFISFFSLSTPAEAQVNSSKIIPDGAYRIGSRRNPNVVAELSAGPQSVVHAWQYIDCEHQEWQFTYNSQKKAYKISNSWLSDQVLTWYNATNKVVGDYFNGENAQFWKIEVSKDGFYKIRNLWNLKKVLELAKGATSNGTPILVNDELTSNNNIGNQEWVIRPIDHKIIPDEDYKTGSQLNQNILVDLSDGDLDQ